jgi:hypothetical protein
MIPNAIRQLFENQRIVSPFARSGVLNVISLQLPDCLTLALIPEWRGCDIICLPIGYLEVRKPTLQVVTPSPWKSI